MAFNPLKLFSRQQNTPAPVPEDTAVREGNAVDGANERGSATFNDVQTFRPEIGDEVVVQGMLNNKYPENMKHELLDQDGKFGPEVLSLDKSTPKLAEAVASPESGVEPTSVVDHPVYSVEEAKFASSIGIVGPEILSLDKSSPKLAEAIGAAPGTNADGILPYLEQQNYHGGGEAMQDVFVTEFTGSDEQMTTVLAHLRERGLIDTSTGEIVWADEATSNFTGSDEELGALIAWLRGNNLIDTSTGEIVWIRQPADGSNWYVPELDSDQSGMAREFSQVSVGGFGGGVDEDRMVRVATGDVNNDGVPEVTGANQVSVGGFGGGPDRSPADGAPYFEDSVRTAREAAISEPPTEEVGFVFHATDGDAPATEASALHGYGTVSGVLSGHSGGWSVAGDWDGDAQDTLGPATLLDTTSTPTDSFSLNFEEIKQTVVDSLEVDPDVPDHEIEYD